MGGEWGGGSGCFIANITAPLVAQGTMTGLLLAALVWTGAGLLGLLLLGILVFILLGLCALCSSLLQCGPCDCGDCGEGCEGSGGSGGRCDDCCPDPEGGGGGSGGGGSGSGGDAGGGGTGGGGSGGGAGGETGGGGGTGGGGSGGLQAALGGVIMRASTSVGVPVARLAHHPDTTEYEQDVYKLGATRLCIGCFTTYPLFLVVAGALFFWGPADWWVVSISAGLVLALSQAVSSAGWARTRAAKVVVKASLGVGLALFVYGTLASPWHSALQFVALTSALALAVASTVPRRRRMRRAGRTCAHADV